MIIDFHTHIAGGQGQLTGASSLDLDKVLADMAFNHIERSLLLPLDALIYQTVNENKQIADCVRRYPDKFEGLGTVSPRKPAEAVPEMTRCIEEHRLLGLKFHPWLQAFSPLESSFMELAAEANLRKTMFFFHDGTPPYSEPFQIAEVAEKNPDLTVVMGHTGLNDLWRESMLAAKKYDNIWLCFSACPHWGMLEVIRTVDHGRLMWGSDYPLATRLDTLNRIRQVELLPISDDVKEKILFTNAQALIANLKSRQRQH